MGGDVGTSGGPAKITIVVIPEEECEHMAKGRVPE